MVAQLVQVSRGRRHAVDGLPLLPPGPGAHGGQVHAGHPRVRRRVLRGRALQARAGGRLGQAAQAGAGAFRQEPRRPQQRHHEGEDAAVRAPPPRGDTAFAAGGHGGGAAARAPAAQRAAQHRHGAALRHRHDERHRVLAAAHAGAVVPREHAAAAAALRHAAGEQSDAAAQQRQGREELRQPDRAPQGAGRRQAPRGAQSAQRGAA
mmetsp:Transcript_32733/g.76352  ORF Transcript_32733/g.76352 Transcript_32733/m.76352 type:complete len:207 (-) Transcript_32733:1387-2007(-)